MRMVGGSLLAGSTAHRGWRSSAKSNRLGLGIRINSNDRLGGKSVSHRAAVVFFRTKHEFTTMLRSKYVVLVMPSSLCFVIGIRAQVRHRIADLIREEQLAGV